MNYPIEKNVPFEWEPGDVILNLYEVKNAKRDFENKNNESHYHEGGFGRVYKVWHRAWNLHMAVKTPKAGMFTNQAQKELFFKECETWINLGLHPHVAACHYVRELGGIPRVFSEYADSGTLAEWISSKRLYEGDSERVLSRILDFAIQFAWGLHHSHESGVIHQDVKPQNALIFGDDILKVCDFGIAGVKANFGSGGNPRSLDSGYQTIMVKGGSALTLEYCSPEQYSGRELSRKSDIWSWGISVLEMFTGEVTWVSGTAAQQVLEQYLENEELEQIIVQMPDKLVNLLRSCFENDPAQRPKTMLQCADAIRSIIQDDLQTEYIRNDPAPIIGTPTELNNRGLSLIDLGKNKEAMEALRQAFSIDSSDREAIYNYSLFRWRNQQISDNQFLESLSLISSGNTINERTHLELGLANYELGFFEEAINYLSGNIDDIYRNRIAAFYYHKSIFHQESANNPKINLNTKGEIKDLVISDNSKKILVLSESVCCYDILENKVIEFEQSNYVIKSIKFRSDSQISFGASDKHLIFWNAATGRIIHEIQVNGKIINFFPQTDNETVVATIFYDTNSLSHDLNARIELIDLRTGVTRKQYLDSEHGNFISWTSPDGMRLISSGINRSYFSSGDICIWNLVDGKYLHYSKNAVHAPNILYLFADMSKFIATIPDQDGLVTMDIKTGATISKFGEELGRVESIMLSSDELLAVIFSKLKVSGSSTHQWTIYDLSNTVAIRILFRSEFTDTFKDSLAKKNAMSRHARVSPNGSFVAWMSQENTMQIFHCGNHGGAPYVFKHPEEYSTICERGQIHSKLIAQAKREFEIGNYGGTITAIRDSRSIVGYESNPEALEIWESLLSVIVPAGVIEMRKSSLLLSDHCLIDEHHFSGKFCFDSLSPEIVIGVETMYDTNRKRANAGIVCWNSKTNSCRVLVESLPKMREIEAIAVFIHDMKKVIVCADGRFILGYDDGGLLVWKIDRGKFQYLNLSAASIDVSSCGSMVACAIRKSWRDESSRPVEMLPVEVWTIPEGIPISVRIHPETKFAVGIKFLMPTKNMIIFGCNLGIQICNLAKKQFSIFGGELGEVYLLEVSTCGNFVAAAYQNGKVKNAIEVYSLGNPTSRVLSMMADARVIDVKFAPGAEILIIYLENKKLQFLSMITLENCFEKTVDGDKVELSPDGNTVYEIGFGTFFGYKILWDY